MQTFLSIDLQKGRMNHWSYVFIFIVPVILVSGTIFYISSLVGINLSDSNIPLDKMYHFIIFSILSYTIFRMICYKDYKIGWIFIISVISSSLYGVLDEYHQIYVPSRVFDLYDIYADVSGSIFGGLIGIRFYRIDYRMMQKFFKTI